MTKIIILFLIMTYTALVSAGAVSPGSLFVYEGVLTDSQGEAITTEQTVRFDILMGSCILYSETHKMTPGSLGEFSAVIGTGNRLDNTGNSAARIFAFSGIVGCDGAESQIVSQGAVRHLKITVGSVVLSPNILIGHIPYAINAQRLNDKESTDFVGVNAVKGVTQNNLESIFERFTKLDAILNNSNSAGTSLGVNISGNASTATTASSLTGGINSILPAQTGHAGKYLKTDGTNVTWEAAFDTDVDSRVDARITAARNSANGIAGLDASAKIPTSLLPNSAIFSGTVQTGALKLLGPSSSEIQISAPSSGLTSYNLVLPTATGTAGQVLKIGSASGTSVNLVWGAVSGAGGSLSSVGFSLPTDVFQVINSPLTVDGTISVTAKSQAQKYVWAAPNSTSGAPVFRQLLVSDLINAGTASLYDVPVTGNASSGQLVKGDDSRLMDARAPIDNSVTTAKIAAGAVTDAKIDSMAATKLTGTVARAQLPVADGNTSGQESGILSGVAQAIKGVKTFLNGLIVAGDIDVTGNINVTGSMSADRIKLAKESSASCDNTTEGSIRYNSTSRDFEGCNGIAWTSLSVKTDPCLIASPAPGQICTGGTIYIGSLSPGAISGGSVTDRYMTTPGGCGEIPIGQIIGSGSSAYTSVDFTPQCSGSTDYLTKFWNDGLSNYSDIVGLDNYTATEGIKGSTNRDSKYGSEQTTVLVAITEPHAAARYCDKLVYGGYSDWYLPNRYELNLLFTNKAVIPGLNVGASTFYWSSAESTSNSSWVQRFSDGYQNAGSKSASHLVRCVRRF